MTALPRPAGRGVALMVAATAVFALQDGLSRHLAEAANVLTVVTIRYWFFAAFALLMARRAAGSLRAAVRTARPGLQALRGLVLAAEVCVMVAAFTLLGLVESHAVFTASPLIVAALGALVLGERVGPWRWGAIAVGGLGVLLILRPGAGVLRAEALVPLAAAGLWAAYGILTRLAGRADAAATSFLWAGGVGALALTPLGLWAWEPLAGGDWAVMAALCLSGVGGHWLVIRAYAVAEASALQPFAYLQLVFAVVVGVVAFREVVTPPVLLGASVVVAAGLFTLWRERTA